MTRQPPPGSDRRPFAGTVRRLARRVWAWAPTPRRAGRWATRHPGAAVLCAVTAAGLAWAAFPHARAQWVGHRMRYAGHGVTFGHHLPETARAWAPLPRDAGVWTTPAGVWYGGSLRKRTTDFGDWVDDVTALPHVRSVGFDHAHGVTADRARRLAGLHAEPVVVLARSSFEPGGLRPLVSLPHLTSVQLVGCHLPGGELRAVAGAAGLDFLRVEGCTGVRGDLATLAGRPTLRFVFAQGSDLTDDSLAGLAGCPGLARLQLGGTRVTDAGLSALGSGSAKVAGLDLAGTRVTDAGLAALGPQPRLASLILADTAVTDAGVLRMLENAPSLDSLDLTGTAATAAALEPLRDRRNATVRLPAAVVPPKTVPDGWEVEDRGADGVTLWRRPAD